MAKTTMSLIKSRFVGKGTTLHSYCKANNIDPSEVTKVFNGLRQGEEAKKLKKRIIQASKERG